MVGHKIFYTPGEFARLFHMDKQTLIYYDNQGIFSPAHKSENGYRYYSTEQILSFAELWSLRHLQISGNALSEFNQAPSRKKLLELLSDKVMEYEETITALQNTISNLERKVSQIKKSSFLPMNQVMLIPKGRLYVQRSPRFAKEVTLRDAGLKSAPLITEYASHLFDKDMQLSLEPDISSLSEIEHPYPYRILLLSEDPSGFTNPLSYEPALYLTLLLPLPIQEASTCLSTIESAMTALHLSWYQRIFLTMIPLDAEKTNAHRYGCKIEIAVSSLS